MKLLIIRHGDPDYKNDSLTEKGWREARCLSEMLCGQDITYFYTSPYGRAQDTAAVTLQKMDRTAEVLDWLREFDHKIHRPDVLLGKKVPWDWLPQDWTADERFYQKDHWSENERMAAGGVGEEYRKVTEQFDALMEKHGYRREGGYWRAERPNHDTIALFCHFGLECVLLSHIFGVSPMTFWHHSCAAPASVTTLVTEERRKGIASLRMLAFGDTSHLYAKGEPPAFAARFCECFDDEARHD